MRAIRCPARRSGALAAALAALALLAPLACGEITKAEGEACSVGTDCIFPAVCCTAPRIPAIGDPVPLCESLRYCDAWLPVLHEGNPCEPGAEATPLTQCAEPWICCEKTRRCATADDCAAAPEPAPTVSSGADCDDPDGCGPGQYCAGLSIREREGTCRAFVEAPPDAGPP